MNIVVDGKEMRFPDFLVAGAARSGTTALYEHLRNHPGIFMPHEKEPMFLSLWKIGSRREYQSGELVHDWSIPDMSSYAALFDGAARDQLCGEASVWYLYDHEAVISNIRELYGEQAGQLKIILLLRNPSVRAWSHHTLKRSRLKEPLPFEEAIRPETIRQRLAEGLVYSYDYIGFGMYAKQVKAWKAAFPGTRVWIHEEFFTNLEQSVKEVAAFLGVEMDPALMIRQRVNASGMHRSAFTRWLAKQLLAQSYWKSAMKRVLPASLRYHWKMRTLERMLKKSPIPDNVREQLAKIYEPDIRELETVLGRSLDLWRNPALPPAGSK